MEPTDITIEILKDIRAELRATRDDLGGRIDQTNERLDVLNRRVVESEMRTATAITELAGGVHEVAALLRAQHDLRPRVEQCEREIADLRRRLP